MEKGLRRACHGGAFFASYAPAISCKTFVAVMAELHKIQETRWLRSLPTSGDFSLEKIDAEAGIIRDVVMVQEGEAKGHDVHLDSEFIEDIVAYDQRNFSKIGLKARFGHPGASSETMGTQLGIFHNFRKRELGGKAQAIADLHLLESAELSPSHPGMKSWVLKMAEEQPDFMMSSIVFRGDGYYQRDQTGKKHKLQISYDEDGRYFKGYKEEYGNIYISLGDHYYTDLVEMGAATENLFSNQVNPHLFVAQADQFLHDHPELKQFIQANPDKVTAFFASIGISITTQTRAKSMATKPFSIFSWLLGEESAPTPQPEDLDDIRQELSAVREEVMNLNKEKETAENRVQELEQGNAALQSAVGELESQLSKAQQRIEELEAMPVASHSGGVTAAGATESSTPVWDKFKKEHGLN